MYSEIPLSQCDLADLEEYIYSLSDDDFHGKAIRFKLERLFTSKTVGAGQGISRATREKMTRLERTEKEQTKTIQQLRWKVGSLQRELDNKNKLIADFAISTDSINSTPSFLRRLMFWK